jgi:hypothetical protein
MEVEPKSCWFCRRPVLVGEHANRAPRGGLAVHTECLQADAFNEGARPESEGRAGRADPVPRP